MTVASHPLKIQVRAVYVGNTQVKLVQYKNGSGKHFVHVHESETTAKKAALAYIKRHGGRLLTLKHGGGRNITFVLRHQRYEFDPNRIFTKAGISSTLRSLSHYSPAAAIEVKKLADTIRRAISQGKIIAVHNNQAYSIREYMKGGAMRHNARAVFLGRRQNPGNFYFVTRQSTYHRLKRKGFSVVWQARHPEDDGSMSVYYKNRNYINVEARYHAYAKQLRMLYFFIIFDLTGFFLIFIHTYFK